MREIKFRAIEHLNQEMVYGYYYKDENGNDCILDLNGWEEHIVDNLEQYTGLKDKNGKEIYEGDILWWGAYDDDGEKETHVIEYCITAYSSYVNFGRTPNLEKFCEITGNIHE